MDDGSSFYSSSLYGKTESSDQEQEVRIKYIMIYVIYLFMNTYI